MLDFIVDFFCYIFFEGFLETAVGAPFEKFIDYIINRVKSRPLRIIIYILSSILCIALVIAIVVAVIFVIIILISINS